MIAIASSCYPPLIRGGAEYSTKALAESLVKRGLEVVSISFSDSFSDESINGVRVIRLIPEKGYSIYFNNNASIVDKVAWRLREEYSPVLAEQINKVLVELSVSVLVTSTIEDVSCFVWKLARENGIKTVHILRSYYLMCLPGTLFKNNTNCNGRCLECVCLNWNKKKSTQYVDHVIGISDFVLQEHLKYNYFPNAEKSVIGNICFGATEFSNYKKINTNTKSTETIIKIGYLGRIHKTKGIDDIINAMLVSNADNMTLEIAGEGSESAIAELKKLSEPIYSRVTFVGQVDAFEFLKNIDVLVIPSKWKEPFGRIVMEAYITKTPVVARASGGLTELVRDGQGWLYSSQKELNDILNNIDRNDMGHLDFDIVNEFTQKSISNQWMSVLQGL
jgi:glycosyltransferase involved in cell wall biosynthesis